MMSFITHSDTFLSVNCNNYNYNQFETQNSVFCKMT